MHRFVYLLSGFEYVAELSDSELKANDISSVLLVSDKMHDLDSGIIWMVFPQGEEKLKNWKKEGYKLSCLEFDFSVHVAGVVFLNSLWSCYSAAFGPPSFNNWNDSQWRSIQIQQTLMKFERKSTWNMADRELQFCTGLLFPG